MVKWVLVNNRLPGKYGLADNRFFCGGKSPEEWVFYIFPYDHLPAIKGELIFMRCFMAPFVKIYLHLPVFSKYFSQFI